MTAPAAPTPSGGAPPAAPDKIFDSFAWLSGQEPTWASWATGAALGAFCLAFGLRGIYARWRGEAPDSKKGIPTLPMALGLFVFGAWVLWVFGISRLPGG